MYKNLIKNKKIIPVYILVLYPLLIGLDIFATYLATPDLKLEANPIIRYFGWGWIDLISYSFIIVVIIIISTILANKYIVKYLYSKKLLIASNKLVFLLSCAFIIFFYSHFIGSCLASISNYFAYLYLFSKSDNLFYSIAVCFVDFYKKYSVAAFLTAHYSISTLTAILITIYRISHVKRYVQSAFSSGNP